MEIIKHKFQVNLNLSPASPPKDIGALSNKEEQTLKIRENRKINAKDEINEIV